MEEDCFSSTFPAIRSSPTYLYVSGYLHVPAIHISPAIRMSA
ncbi:MAG: hypothetical protein AB1847_08780 [bacterium]